jgi:DNA-binding NarL/FixJ family response regulator
MITTLLVEDNALFRKSLKDMLIAWVPSMVIEEAENCQLALTLMEALTPQIIFMDIQLPDGNGLALTKKIKSIYPQIIILVLTSHDLPEYRDVAFQNGADFFLYKGSITQFELLGLIQTITGNLNPCQGSPNNGSLN